MEPFSDHNSGGDQSPKSRGLSAHERRFDGSIKQGAQHSQSPSTRYNGLYYGLDVGPQAVGFEYGGANRNPLRGGQRQVTQCVSNVPHVDYVQSDTSEHIFARSGYENVHAQGNGGFKENQSLQVAGGQLRMIADVIPPSFRSLFQFPHFNAMQSACVDVALFTDRNLVVSAPTGSGKTCVMELAILHTLLPSLRSDPRSTSSDAVVLDPKIVYLAPTKALVSERARDWSARFGGVAAAAGLGGSGGCRIVAELTGDSDYRQVQDIQKATIIVSTPEKVGCYFLVLFVTLLIWMKWDSLTRRFRDHRALFRLVRLVLLDEVHVLGEPGRGAALETVVARMRTIDRDLNGGARSGTLRVVAMSATVPNVGDVAEWLGGAEVRVFGEEFRPVQLERFVYGFADASNPFLFEKLLNYKLLDIINKHSHGQATLVFCSTRKSTVSATDDVIKSARDANVSFVCTESQRSRLKFATTSVGDKKLKEVLVNGVAFHHAGLESGDRRIVERLFLDGLLRLICTTTTLAVGVNLPAHLVILKGTQQYANGKYSPYSELDIMQILGRAGRPQFDDTGVAVILTTTDRRDFYENLVTGRSVVESQLHEDLVEQKNPLRYGVDLNNTSNGGGLVDRKLAELARTNVDKLKANGLAVVDPVSKLIVATEIAHVMAKYYIQLASGRVKDISDKVFFVIQGLDRSATDTRLSLMLGQESSSILHCASRIAKAFVEVAAIKKDAHAVRSALKLQVLSWVVTALQEAARTFEDAGMVLRQVEGIGPEFARKLSLAGIKTIDQLQKEDIVRLERILGRGPSFARNAIEAASKFPSFTMTMKRLKDYTDPHVMELFVEVKQTNANWKPFSKVRGRASLRVAFVVTTNDDAQLFEFSEVPANRISEGCNFRVKTSLSKIGQKIMVSLIPEDMVGFDTVIQSPYFVNQNSVENRDVDYDFGSLPEGFLDELDSFKIVDHQSMVEQSHVQNEEQGTVHGQKKNTSEEETRTCRHKCKDRKACLHLCCKEEVFTKSKRKRPSEHPQPLDMKAAKKVAADPAKSSDDEDPLPQIGPHIFISEMMPEHARTGGLSGSPVLFGKDDISFAPKPPLPKPPPLKWLEISSDSDFEESPNRASQLAKIPKKEEEGGMPKIKQTQLELEGRAVVATKLQPTASAPKKSKRRRVIIEDSDSDICVTEPKHILGPCDSVDQRASVFGLDDIDEMCRRR
ncbi:Sec63 [Gonapodya sp. JEL0774]|nr:Sec63 [Gonapodya sp. JEL0774]